MSFLQLLQSFDFSVLDWIQTHLSCRALDLFFSTITHLGDAGLFWIAVGIAMVCTKRFRKSGICLLLAISLGFLCGNLIIKPLVARTRPYDVNTMITLLIKAPTDYSFPSGHTTASVASALAIFYYHRKLGISALILAGLIALSRMYLYVHYPSDILVGIIVGAAASIAAYFLVNGAYQRRERRRVSDVGADVSQD